MKKLALTALAAAIATVGLASTASANSRNGDEEWRRPSHRDGGDWDGRRDHGRRDEWRQSNRRDHWRQNRDRPRFVYREDYCFVKKVRRQDDWGNVYIKRVRVCR